MPPNAGLFGLVLTIGASLLNTPTRPTRAQVAQNALRSGERPLINEAQVTANAALMLPPVGSGLEWYADALPQGPEGVRWDWADGGTLPIDEYPDLYALWGTRWNTGGEPAGHFRKPDRRQRVGLGAGNSGATGLTARALGERFGEEKHELSISEMPRHDHNQFTSEHTHDHIPAGGTKAGSTDSSTHKHGGSTGNNTHNHDIGFENFQMDASFGPGRKVYSPQDWPDARVIEDTGSNTHNHSIGDSSHSHDITSMNSNTHSHSISVEGGNATLGEDRSVAHNNMPPAIVVHFVVRIL